MSVLIKRRPVINHLLQVISKNSVNAPKCIATFARSAPEMHILPSNTLNFKIIRLKSKSSKKKEAAAESDVEESDEERSPADFDSLLVDKNTKVMTVKINSLRTDTVLKNSLGIARNKIEEMFYESKIRINGKKLQKKSDAVQQGDEVDIIKGINVENPKFLQVARVEILDINVKKEFYNIRVRRCKNLTIENYVDTWKGDEAV